MRSRSTRTAGFGRPPKPLTDEAEALFDLVKQAGADLGQSIGWQPSGGVCDGNNIAACGVPVVDTMGVRGGKIHSMEEYLIVDSLKERAALSALTILRLAAEARMTFRVRPVRGEDFAAIYEMAKLTGGGFTNLPPDRATLVAKLARSEQSFSRETDEQEGDMYMFVLEDPKEGVVRGTCQVFGQVGVIQPFYSYHLSTLTQSSPELGKTFRNQLLTLTTDLEGSSEVGGLFLHPQARAGGWGALLARSRYLFMRAAPRALRRAHAGRASRGDGRGRQLPLLGRARPAAFSA